MGAGISNGIILVIDDERLPISYYISSLERAQWTVRHLLKCDEVDRVAREASDEIDLIILDIMMPSGNSYSTADTNYGLRTGVLLYRDLRKMLPHTPIVILTNVSNHETLDSFPKEKRTLVCQKLDTPPSKLVDIVRAFLELK